jgi:S-layer protein
VTLATGTALTKAINLGAGDDTLVFGVAVTGSTAALNGGDGIDTLSMTAANADALDAAKQTFYTGFERLTINNAFGAADSSVETLTLNLDNLGFTNYVTTSGTNQQVGSIDKLVLDKMSNNGTVVLTATGDVAVNVTDAATGTADVLNAVLSSTGNLNAGTLTAANVETVNISTVDTEVVVAPAVQTKNVDTLTLTADKATAVNVTGAADLTLTLTGSTKVTSIDGSTMTGGLTVTSLNTTAATTIKGGSGNDVLTAATGTTADVLIGGAGNDTLVANAGMSTLTGGAGNDLFVIGTASANVNSYATITDFAAGDLLKMTGIDSFASAKVSLGDTAVFQDYANAALNALNANAGGWFQFSGNTYVVADMGTDSTSGFVNGEDFIVKLTGLVDLSNASFNNDSDTIALV